MQSVAQLRKWLAWSAVALLGIITISYYVAKLKVCPSCTAAPRAGHRHPADQRGIHPLQVRGRTHHLHHPRLQRRPVQEGRQSRPEERPHRGVRQGPRPLRPDLWQGIHLRSRQRRRQGHRRGAHRPAGLCRRADQAGPGASRRAQEPHPYRDAVADLQSEDGAGPHRRRRGVPHSAGIGHRQGRVLRRQYQPVAVEVRRSPRHHRRQRRRHRRLQRNHPERPASGHRSSTPAIYQPDRTLTADKITMFFEADNTVQHAQAEGNVNIEVRGPTIVDISGPRGDLNMGPAELR